MRNTYVCIRLVIAAGLLLAADTAHLYASVLVSRSTGLFGYGYGFSEWDNFTADLNAASSNQVTVVSSFANLEQMLSFDALLLDQRWTNGVLSNIELSNIATVASTDRRVLMIGENDEWDNWNNQILSIVGGSYASHTSGTAQQLVLNEITDGVPAIGISADGTANPSANGIALYSPNFATLWGENRNVLTVLSANVWDDTRGTAGRRFGANVALWLTSGPQAQIPEPGCGSLAVLTLGGCIIGPRHGRKRSLGEMN